jgi:hypothetical protein
MISRSKWRPFKTSSMFKMPGQFHRGLICRRITLSADHPSFNPYNYQTGAVWPHDNSLIALGMRRYGFAAEARRWHVTSAARRVISC